MQLLFREDPPELDDDAKIVCLGILASVLACEAQGVDAGIFLRQ